MRALLNYFAKNHLLVNLITILVFLGGVYAWNHTKKEELPDISFNVIRIYTTYPGAAAADVEFYVTKPIEESLEGIDGIRQLTSASGQNNSTVSLYLNRDIKDIASVVTEVQNQVATVQLPAEVLDDPRVRYFETSKKAIIDIALYHQTQALLDVESRAALQALAMSLENRLLVRPEIFELRKTGFLTEVLNIEADPEKLAFYDLSLSTVAAEIRRNHVRTPAGNLQSNKNQQVTLLSELDSKPKLDQLVVQGGFDSTPIPLKTVARISDGFEDSTMIYKVNGREAVMFEVVKNSAYGILETLQVVRQEVSRFEASTLSDTDFALGYLDDESIDLRARLSIIASNGLLGFLLIVATLFLFLNKRSGFWVALGIPFTLCFTLLAGHLLGFTINGITLAGIIIVLGIVVDDAIIVAENISRKINEGMPITDAVVTGAKEVWLPILASILTTCAAFLPLYFFTGRFSGFVKVIPPMIFLMLFASLLESFLLLPGHMAMFPSKAKATSPGKRWFEAWESQYERFLCQVLAKRYWIIGLFILALMGTGWLVQSKFQFVMFPRQESRDIVISGKVPGASSPKETSQAIQPLEDYLRSFMGQEAVGFRTGVARGRRGNAAVENEFRITFEIVSPDKRQKSADEIIADIKTFAKDLNLGQLRFRKSRFGSSSGSSLEIFVQDNNDASRQALVNDLIAELKAIPQLTDVEADVIPSRQEYQLSYKQDELKRLSVNPATLSDTLRTIINGKRLYTLPRQDDEIDVTLTVAPRYRNSIQEVLSVAVENSRNYLLPLKDIVTITSITAKKTIRREEGKRTSFVDADLVKGSGSSPIEMATFIEATVFPKLLAKYPSAQLRFDGEVKDTKESREDLIRGVLLALVLIYVILILLFNSLFKPLRVLLVVPFGIIGVIVAFYLHQKTQFGFYAAIGTLGMLGVVVNDAIVMLSKLDKHRFDGRKQVNKQTAAVAKTRLRAIVLTTLTTVAGVMPTAYGFGGTDPMLSDMMFSLAWGLVFGTLLTLVLTPCMFVVEQDIKTRAYKYLPKLSLWALALVGTVLLTGNTWAATAVSLDQFLGSSMAKDPQFQRLLQQQLQVNYQFDANIDPAALNLSVLSGLSYQNEMGSDSTVLVLSKALPNNGQTLSAGLSLSDGASTSTLSFSQDLARNAFGKVQALQQLRQETRVALAKHQLTEAYEDYLAQLTNLYYTWVRQHENLKLAHSSLAENQKVLDSINARKMKKIANQTDVNKFSIQILSRQDQVTALAQTYAETSININRAMGAPLDSVIAPDIALSPPSLNATLAGTLSRVKAQSRTYAILALLEQEQQSDLAIAKRNLLPSAALNLSWVGDPDADATYSAALSMALPLRNAQLRAIANRESAALSEVQASNAFDSTVLTAQLTGLWSAIEAQQVLLENAYRRRDIAKAVIDDETENYSFGKISLNDYIQAVNFYDNARFNAVDRALTLLQLQLEWKRLTDTLVQSS